MTVDPSAAALSLIVCGAIALGAWIWALPALRGSTLLGPWIWWLLVLIPMFLCASVMQIHASGAPGEGSWTTEKPLPFLAAVGIFCPTMSLLGAKRPQDQGWHFVVATLWCVLALPALEAALMRPGEAISVHGLRGWFLWILIATEIANRLATRTALAGCMHASAAVLLLAPHLPLLPGWHWSNQVWLIAVGLECAALVQFALIARRKVRERSWNRVWSDFRDRWGALWSLRVAERINAAAVMYGWPLRLNWRGFRPTSTDSDAELFANTEQRAAFQQTVDNLLRRFVSERFLRERAP